MRGRTCDWGWWTPTRIQKEPHKSSILSKQLEGTSWGSSAKAQPAFQTYSIHFCKDCRLNTSSVSGQVQPFFNLYCETHGRHSHRSRKRKPLGFQWTLNLLGSWNAERCNPWLSCLISFSGLTLHTGLPSFHAMMKWQMFVYHMPGWMLQCFTTFQDVWKRTCPSQVAHLVLCRKWLMISENSQMSFAPACPSTKSGKGEGRHHNDFSCHPLWNLFPQRHTPSLSCSAAMDQSWPCTGMGRTVSWGTGHSHRRKTRWWARNSSWLSQSPLEFHCVGSNSVTRPKTLALCRIKNPHSKTGVQSLPLEMLVLVTWWMVAILSILDCIPGVLILCVFHKLKA